MRIHTLSHDQNYNLEIFYGIHATPFGICLLGLLNNTVCYLAFLDDHQQQPETLLHKEFPQAVLSESQAKTAVLTRTIFSRNRADIESIELTIIGTDFQVNVWRALAQIPHGSLTNYSAVATMIGNPKASRAVGRAIGRNRIAYLIPCHRVITKSGNLHKFMWGADLKKKLIEAEKNWYA